MFVRNKSIFKDILNFKSLLLTRTLTSVQISLLIQTRPRINFFVRSLMLDLFLTNTQLLASQDVNRWTGVVWIIVMFLSAVWTLILTAPIQGSIAEQVMQCYISPNLFLSWPEGEQIEHFWVNYSFNSPCRHWFDPSEETLPDERESFHCINSMVLSQTYRVKPSKQAVRKLIKGLTCEAARGW